MNILHYGLDLLPGVCRLQTVTFVYWSQLPWEPSRSNHYTLNQQDLDGQLQELLLFLTDFKFYCIISLAILVNVCFNERKLYKLLHCWQIC